MQQMAVVGDARRSKPASVALAIMEAVLLAAERSGAQSNRT